MIFVFLPRLFTVSDSLKQLTITKSQVYKKLNMKCLIKVILGE